jgi:four helix bundle protein
MEKCQDSKRYDLEERTLGFARDVRTFVRKLNHSISNIEDAKQLIRSSGSVGANYIEANEALSKKDFVMRIKISRKEAKESTYWLKLLFVNDAELETVRDLLVRESVELTNIFGAIVRKSSGA